MKSEEIFGGYYLIKTTNYFTINPTIKKKCIFNNIAVTKDDFKSRFVDELAKYKSDIPRVCWCWTHKPFKRILRTAGFKVYGLLLFPGNISKLIAYWECTECEECPENKKCYIPEYIQTGCKRDWKKREGICIIINPKNT